MEKTQGHDFQGKGFFFGEAVESGYASPELRGEETPADAAEADAAATLLMHLGHSTRASGQARLPPMSSVVPPWTSTRPDMREADGSTSDATLSLLAACGIPPDVECDSVEAAALRVLAQPEDEAARNLMLSTALPADSEIYKSGVQGVRWNRQYHRWGAIWREEGRQRHKYFSALKYGFHQAKLLAVAYRRKMESQFGKHAKSRTATSAPAIDDGGNPVKASDILRRRIGNSEAPHHAAASRRSNAGQHILPDQLACLFMDGAGEYDDDAPTENPFSSEGLNVDSPYHCEVPGVIWDADARSWKTKWVEEGRKFGKTFPAAKHGFERAKELAIAYRYRLESSGRLSTSETHVRHIYASATPPRGVSFNDSKNCFVAAWRFNNQTGKKKFSVAEHGFDEAQVAATAYLEALCAAVGAEGTDADVMSDDEGEMSPSIAICDRVSESADPEILSLPMLKRSRGDESIDDEIQDTVVDADGPKLRRQKLSHQTTVSSSTSSAPHSGELSSVVAELIEVARAGQAAQGGCGGEVTKALDEQLAMFFVSLGSFDEDDQHKVAAADSAVVPEQHTG